MTRLAQIINRLKTEQIDAMLIFDDQNITYLSGFTGSTALVLTDKGLKLITQFPRQLMEL